MSYYYPQPVAPPTIPATLPPNPLNIIGPAANYTITTNDDIILCFASLSIFLPITTSIKYKPYYIKLWGAITVTIYPSGSEKIDGLDYIVIKVPMECRVVTQWPGAGWLSV